MCAATVSLAWGCSDATYAQYDPAECRRLAVAAEQSDSLSQDDYAAMIAQEANLLDFLADEHEKSAQPDESDSDESRRLLEADPEYAVRASLADTFGSVLNQAYEQGRLDNRNSRAYLALDRYNARFSD